MGEILKFDHLDESCWAILKQYKNIPEVFLVHSQTFFSFALKVIRNSCFNNIFLYLQIAEITSVDEEKPVRFTQEVGFSVEKYEIV